MKNLNNSAGRHSEELIALFMECEILSINEMLMVRGGDGDGTDPIPIPPPPSEI